MWQKPAGGPSAHLYSKAYHGRGDSPIRAWRGWQTGAHGEVPRGPLVPLGMNTNRGRDQVSAAMRKAVFGEDNWAPNRPGDGRIWKSSLTLGTLEPRHTPRLSPQHTHAQAKEWPPPTLGPDTVARRGSKNAPSQSWMEWPQRREQSGERVLDRDELAVAPKITAVSAGLRSPSPQLRN